MAKVLLLALACLASSSALKGLPKTKEADFAMAHMVDNLFTGRLKNTDTTDQLPVSTPQLKMIGIPLHPEKRWSVRSGPVSYEVEDGVIKFNTVIIVENVQIQWKAVDSDVFKSAIVAVLPKVRYFGEVTADRGSCSVKMISADPVSLQMDALDVKVNDTIPGVSKMAKVLFNSILSSPEVQEARMENLRQQLPEKMARAATKTCPDSFQDFLKENARF